MINNLYYTTPKEVSQKNILEIFSESCEKTDPKPIYCEPPDDLIKFSLRDISLTHTNIASSASTSSTYGTSPSTTTTF